MIHKKIAVAITICKLLPTLMAVLSFLGCQGSPSRVVIECGGGAQFSCPNGMFCNLSEKCGGVDKTGVCIPQPSNCPSDGEPVCGCDNSTYTNVCFAHASGVTVAYEGSCIKKVETKRTEGKIFNFPEPGKDVDGSRIENAGDDISEQYRSF